jgi:hypothetical protein
MIYQPLYILQVKVRLQLFRTKVRKEAERLTGVRPTPRSLANDSRRGYKLYVGICTDNPWILFFVSVLVLVADTDP